jgi:hypothetical protein
MVHLTFWFKVMKLTYWVEAYRAYHKNHKKLTIASPHWTKEVDKIFSGRIATKSWWILRDF